MVENRTHDSQTTPFAAIWQRYPERQRWGSSTWWYFILAPKQSGGYGPKQAMFSFLSVNGDSFRLNGRSHLGLARPCAEQPEAAFHTTAIGWIFDGQKLHEDIVHHCSSATLSAGALEAWTEGTGRARGGALRARSEQPLGIEVSFRGARGGADFMVWGEPEHEITAPIVHDHSSRLVDYNVVGWRQLQFAGEFTTPAGTEWWEGLGYFQRVCLNTPLFPWKWLWATFADGSTFSCVTAYVGAQLLRRHNRLYPDLLERIALPLNQGGYFWDGQRRQMRNFDRVRMTPSANGGQPRFLIECSADDGDFIRFTTDPYSHVRLLMDRPHLKGLWHSRFNYNEYLFAVDEVEGRVGGRALDSGTLGPGFGNNEYTWGFGF